MGSYKQPPYPIMTRVLILSLLIGCSLGSTLQDRSGLTWRCPQPLANCMFNDVQEGNVTEDWKGCAAQCADNPLCQYWAFVFAPVKHCYIKSGCLVTWPDPNAYSGSKDCVTWDCSEGWEVPECQTTVAPKM